MTRRVRLGGGHPGLPAAARAPPEHHPLPGGLPRQRDHLLPGAGQLDEEERRFRVQPVRSRLLPHYTYGRHYPVACVRVCVCVCSVCQCVSYFVPGM